METKINKPSKDNSQGRLTTKIAHEISPYWESVDSMCSMIMICQGEMWGRSCPGLVNMGEIHS